MKVTVKIREQEIAGSWQQIAELADLLEKHGVRADFSATTVQQERATEFSIQELERGIEYPKLPDGLPEPPKVWVYVGNGWREGSDVHREWLAWRKSRLQKGGVK